MTRPSADLINNRAGKDHALFIAVDDYANWSDLRYPVKDVGRIATELEQRYGFTTETLANPTRRQLLDKLTEYRNRQFAKDGQLLVFFSGHGDFASATSEGFFIPRDGLKRDPYQDSYVALSRLKRAVNAIPCDHIMLAIDACYSGALDDRIAVRANDDPPRFGRPGGNNGMSQAKIDQLVEDRLRTKTRLYFTSGGLEQTPDRSQFVDQFLAALGTTSRREPVLDYNGLRYFLGKARPTPRTGAFDGNKPGTNDFLFIRRFGAALNPDAIASSRTDIDDWEIAQAQDDCSAYRLYLQKHPNGDFAPEANNRIAPCEAEERMLAAWEKAKKRNNCESYKRFAVGYPSSPYTGLVPRKLKELKCRGTEVANQVGADNEYEKPAPANSTNKVNTAFIKDNMIEVTGGTFTLGCSIGRTNCDNDEFPKKNVSIASFYIQRNEVTNSQFLAFLKAYNSDKVKRGEYVGQKMIYPSTSGLSNKNGEWSLRKGYENHPVVDVTWYGAVTFAKFYGLRLPTEAEWEFIAKGGKANDKYAFSGSDNLYNTGIYEGNSNFDSAIVGSKGATHVLGVNDMSGNVWEWTNDWYTSSYNSITSSNPIGPRSGTTKSIRGGSYSDGEWEARVTNRAHKTPVTHANNIGFRCAK